MREFFKSELKTLKIKRGLNQWENLSNMTNEHGEPIGEQSIKMLLDLMVNAANEFPYIPDDEKKRIIQYGILHEPEFMQWTPHHVWKWLNGNSSKYFREIAHKPTKTDAEPVDYQNLAPETKLKVDEFLRSLQEPSRFQMPTVTPEEMKAIEAEDEMKAGVKAKEYTLADFEKEDRLYTHQKKVEYGRLFSDPLSHEGKLLPDSPTFESWLKMNP